MHLCSFCIYWIELCIAVSCCQLSVNCCQLSWCLKQSKFILDSFHWAAGELCALKIFTGANQNRWVANAINHYNYSMHTYFYTTVRCQFNSDLHYQFRLRPFQLNFMLLGPDRPKFWQISFNNDSLRTLVPALVWECLDHFRIRYHTADELVHRYRRDSLCYSHPNTIALCRRTCLSLATHAFRAEINTLALETNALKM